MNMISDTTPMSVAPKLKHETEQPLRAPSFAADVLGVGIISALFAGLFGFAFFRGDIYAGLTVGGAIGSVVVLWRAFRVLDRPISDWEAIIYQDVVVDDDDDEPERADEFRVMIPNANGVPVEFVQPEPAEFANWASAVIRDLRDPELAEHEKTSFSQNTAIRRGWTIGEYKRMFSALLLAGWVERRRNQPPRITSRGAGSLAEWLRNRQPRGG